MLHLNSTPSGVRRVLMVSPHFPPDGGAATHRVRLLAPHLEQYGWVPTVLTVDRSANEGRQDPDLEAMVPSDLRVVRASVWRASRTRRLGIGDLGLRAFTGLYREAARLLATEKYDALFITIFPAYPALLGPLLKSRFKIPFILDYQDPWVSAWGKDVGGGRNGSVDLKSRITRLAARALEPLALRSANAITAVSTGTYELIRQRVPVVNRIPCRAIPIGGDAADFSSVRSSPGANEYFDASDGNFHICYVGTLLPLGFETLRAVFSGLAMMRTSAPESYQRIRIHFFGTSNQTSGTPDARVLPVAHESGVEDRVSEHALRVDYLTALTVQVEASAILLMGSSEPHYTASKLYPALLSGRPILAVYHSESSVTDVMKKITAGPGARLISYSDREPVGNHVAEIADALESLVEHPFPRAIEWPSTEVDKFSARSLAGELAQVLDLVAGGGTDVDRQHRE